MAETGPGRVGPRSRVGVGGQIDGPEVSGTAVPSILPVARRD